jgi:hypothetical protein
MENLEAALNAMANKPQQQTANDQAGIVEFLDKQEAAQTPAEQADAAPQEVTDSGENGGVNEGGEEVNEGVNEGAEVGQQENNEPAANIEGTEDVTPIESDGLLDLEAGFEADDFVVKYADKISELGVEAKTFDEFFEKVKSIGAELEETKAAAESVFATPLLKEANELARQGGDWQQYLAISEINYDQIPDSDLVLYDVKGYKNDPQEAQDFVDGLTDEQMKFHADKVRNELKGKQEAQKQQIKQKAQEYQQWYDKGVTEAVKSVSAVGGVKVPHQTKDKIARMLTSYNNKVNATEFNAKYFLNEKGQPDFKKMSEVAYKLELFDSVVEVAKKQAKVEGKKEMIQKLSNVQPPQQRNIGDATPKKELSFIEAVKSGAIPQL